jgi:hypothetical protein
MKEDPGPHASHDETGDESESAGEFSVGEPALEVGEPHTPMWLPLLGCGLLLAAILAFAVTHRQGKTVAELQSQQDAGAATADVSGVKPAPGAPLPGVPANPMRALPLPTGARQPRGLE